MSKRYYLILGPFERRMTERYLGRKVVEGEILHGAIVVFSRKITDKKGSTIGESNG